MTKLSLMLRGLLVLCIPLVAGQTPSSLKDEELSPIIEGSLGRSASSPPWKQKFLEWRTLKGDVWRDAPDKAGETCNANEDLTHAYFLLGDLMDFHVATGITNYGYPRVEFYDKAFKPLHDVADIVDKSTKRKKRPEIVLCAYDNRLVCVNNTCVSCDNPSVKGHEMLEKGCRYVGDGGMGEFVDEKKVKELPVPVTSDLHTDAKYCEDGWLTGGVVGKKRAYLLSRGKLEAKTSAACSYSSEFQLAWAYLTTLALKSDVDAEVKTHRQFYEDKLRPLKGENAGIKKQQHLCSYAPEKRLVCGRDGLCVYCLNVTDAAVDLYRACHLEEPKMSYKKAECQVGTTSGGGAWKLASWGMGMIVLAWVGV